MVVSAQKRHRYNRDILLQIRITRDEYIMIQDIVRASHNNLTMSEILRAGLYHYYHHPECLQPSLDLHRMCEEARELSKLHSRLSKDAPQCIRAHGAPLT